MPHLAQVNVARPRLSAFGERTSANRPPLLASTSATRMSSLNASPVRSTVPRASTIADEPNETLVRRAAGNICSNDHHSVVLSQRDIDGPA